MLAATPYPIDEGEAAKRVCESANNGWIGKEGVKLKQDGRRVKKGSSEAKQLITCNGYALIISSSATALFIHLSSHIRTFKAFRKSDGTVPYAPRPALLEVGLPLRLSGLETCGLELSLGYLG